MPLDKPVSSMTYNGALVPVSAEEAFAFPPWCVRDVTIDSKVKALLQSSWRTAMAGTATAYLEAVKAQKGMTPLLFLQTAFFDSFSLLSCEPNIHLKSGTQVQACLLTHMVAFAVKSLEDSAAMEESLRHLAVQFNRIGIVASDYALLCLCLTLAIKKALGEAYTEEIGRAWICAISRLLQVMLPVVLSGRITTDTIDLEAVRDYSSESLDTLALVPKKEGEAPKHTKRGSHSDSLTKQAHRGSWVTIREKDGEERVSSLLV